MIIQTANKNMKRCPASSVREVQIKSTRYNVIVIRMATTKKMEKNKCWEDAEELESLSTVGVTVKWCKHYRKQYGSF